MDGSQNGERGTTRVSHRFLTDFFRVLDKHRIPATDLLGDLPIEMGESGEVLRPVEWSLFAELMRRLERAVDGPEGVEACGSILGELKPAGVLRGVGGLAASPYVLYRGAIQWALRRALPAVRTRMTPLEDNAFEVHARLADGLEACPQIFHFATGGARVLPRLFGLTDAVVAAEIDETEACYRITLPPSLTIFARLKRLARSVSSAGSVLQFLETQQLELHAQHAALERAQAALNANEQRYRALTDAALDVLCELDQRGRIVFASASVRDLIGYSTEQVTGSHYHLWIPKEFHAIADARFQALTSRPPGDAIARELLTLHASNGSRIAAEASVRSYCTDEGEWRLVGILRDVTPCIARRAVPAAGESGSDATIDRLRRLARNVGREPGPGSGVAGAIRHDHPLTHSLQTLIGALEALEVRPDPAAAERLIAASSRRMTQIVTAALVESEAGGPDSGGDWIETRKLLDLIQSEFAASHGDGLSGEGNHTLEIHADAAPAQIWTRFDLLAGGLGSLLDHATELAPSRSRFDLAVAPVASTGAIEFVVRVTPREEDHPVRGERDTPRSPAAAAADHGSESDDEPAALARAIARDVAGLLGGEVDLADPDLGPGGGRLRISPLHGPHALSTRATEVGSRSAEDPPETGQSSTRSMSAPSWRSFSSTRS